MIERADIQRLQAEIATPSWWEKNKGPIIIALVASIPLWLAVLFHR